jgi:hypothetical protein
MLENKRENLEERIINVEKEMSVVKEDNVNKKEKME